MSRPRRRSVALAASPGPRANGRDKDPAPAHAAAPGAAHLSRGPNQLASLGVSKIGLCRKPALRQLLSLGVSKTLKPAQGSTVDCRGCTRLVAPSWLGCQVPRRRLVSAAAHVTLPTLLPRPPPSVPRPPPATGHRPVALGACRRPSGLAGRRPPPHRRRGWEDRRRAPRPPARATGDATTLPPSGLPLGPGHHAWSSIPLPARPLRLTVRRSHPPSRAPLARWLLASLYTPRPHLGGEVPSKP
jgi:hypothetical protein